MNHTILPAVRYRCVASASKTMIKVKMIISITPQAVASRLVPIATARPVNVHDPPAVLGTLTIRIEWSALPDTSSDDVGLNVIVVIGNSCALRIVTSG